MAHRPVRVVYCGNNWVGWQVARWLRERSDAEVVAALVHPEPRRRHTDDICAALGLDADAVFCAERRHHPDVLSALRARQPDIALSVLFDYIFERPFLDAFPRGVLNLHPSYLPYNRGQYPNVWSIVEGTPSGVTLHWVDEGIDTGDLVAQRRVEVELVDTGATLYRKLERASVALFREHWPRVADGTAPRVPQPTAHGTSHRRRDVDAIDRIDLDRPYRAGELLDLLRARTFPPYEGAYFEAPDGRRVYLELKLRWGDG